MKIMRYKVDIQPIADDASKGKVDLDQTLVARMSKLDAHEFGGLSMVDPVDQ